MGKTLLFLALLFSNVALAQFKDDFSDGNFTSNPAWYGSSALFTVNANKQLQSVLSNVAQTTYLSTKNSYALNVKWEFFMQMNFDPSATNLTRIYLVSSQEDLRGSLNGYYLQVGEAGTADSYDLFRQTGTTSVKIIDGLAKTRVNANQLSARVRITRDSQGKWELFTDLTGGTNYTLEGSVIDNTHLSTNYFGVFCRYTVTRSNGFIFDDFEVDELVPDVTPPTLVSAKALSSTVVEAVFSKALDSTMAIQTDHYTLDHGYGNPISMKAINQNTYQLTYPISLNTDHYTLTVSRLKDLKGNAIAASNTANFFHIKPYTAVKGDVVINEIFADPTPQIGLPNAEFIELWNTTTEYILLNGWKYSDVATTYTFGSDTIAPNSYLILCPNNSQSDYSIYGKTKGLSPWPVLNNDKDQLRLLSPSAILIDEVNYADTWYKDPVKKDGGYSLELIDPKNSCVGIQNWQASNAIIGGTPGTVNSVYQSQYSNVAPKLLNMTMIDGATFRLLFDKALDSLSASVASIYSFNNGIGAASKADPIAPLFNVVEVKFSSAISRGLEHTLTIGNLTDCAGNRIDPSANSAKLFWAKEILANSLLISEVLFDPKGTHPDYVEVYNNTEDVLDLKDLKLANANAAGNPANIRTVTVNSILIQPKTYWVLTTNPASIQNQYEAKFPNQFVQMNSMPNYNNDRGNVILLSENTTVDRLDYDAKMHHPLLKDPDGVALERISLKRPTNERSNFTSASQLVGFGTPTYANSQAEDELPNAEQFKLVSKTFSPDGDGFEDLLCIDYNLKQSGKMASIYVYSDKGRLVKKLLTHSNMPTSGSLNWDGLDENGKRCTVGIYLIKFEVFDMLGKKDSFTKTCVLASKF